MSNIILPFTFDREETTVRYAGNTSYFIEAVGLDKIKIGRARDVAKRLATLQTGSAVPLKLLATTDTIPERELHRRFRSQRISGEWFRKCDEILALIDEINGRVAPVDAPVPESDSWLVGLCALALIVPIMLAVVFSQNARPVATAQPAAVADYGHTKEVKLSADFLWRNGGREAALKAQHEKLGGYFSVVNGRMVFNAHKAPETSQESNSPK